jgi:hypothetical protein
MIGGWPLFDQTANLTASFNLCAATSVLAAPAPCYTVLSGLHISALLTRVR